MDVGVFYFPVHYGIEPGELAKALEDRGFESLFLCEHTHIPSSRKTPFPAGEPLPKRYIHTHDPFRTITLFNPIVHVISGFRWSFYSVADVPVWSSIAVTLGIIAVCMAVIAWMFRTGYRLKQ